jgi:peroxiredoxin
MRRLLPKSVTLATTSDRGPGCSNAAPRRRLLGVGLALVLCVMTAASAERPPDFRLQDLDGKWFSLGDHLGKEVIYITFWATWCNPCRRELPHLQKMYDELGDQGFLVVAVNTDTAANKSKIKPYVTRHKFTFPHVLDPDNNVLDKFNPTRELPFAVLIDRQGNVHKVYPGYRTGDEVFLKKEVLQLLGAAAEAEGAPDNE